MPGVVAAGQHQTAAVAAAILARGGNPVDAAIAACAAAFVAEPLLCGVGGAGIMTVALGAAEPTVIDFFSDMPGRGLAPAKERHFVAVEIDFGGLARQLFHIGRASAAVPGTLPGLAAAHAQFGSLPLDELMAPAVELATRGVAISAETAHVYRLLWQILAADPDTAAVIAGGDRPPSPGQVLKNPDLADTLRDFGQLGRTPDRVYEGLIDAFGPARGGLITEADVRAYQPTLCSPLKARFGDWSVYLPPSPGGPLALHVARSLAERPPAATADQERLRFAHASQAAHALRGTTTAPGSTTHISVADPERGCAAVTLTNGEGCGYLIPDTGVQVNNFLGEEDLNPYGFHRHPAGLRLPTMVAPCVALHRGVPRLALGSGGSNRIRSAVGQVLYRRIVMDMSLADAVAAPRVHAELDEVWYELEHAPEVATADAAAAANAALAGAFSQPHAFPGRDFFFGGVNAVEVDADGTACGVGDGRRGGVTMSA